MFVVHGVVSPDGRIAVWAEAEATAPRATRTRRAAGGAHPHALVPPMDGEAGTLTLSLPSTAAGPRPSPLAGGTPSRVSTAARPWTVPVVFPSSDVDIEALVGDLDGALAAPSIGFLTDVRTLAASLIARGRFVPGVALDPLTARWRAVLSGADRARFDDLVRALPLAALAATPDASAAGHAGHVLSRVLDVEVDTRVRRRLNAGLRPDGTADGAVGAWLHALTGPDGRFDAPAAEVERLHERLDEWLGSAATGAVRLCFRLTDLDEDARTGDRAGWQLEFLLQAVDEPSVLIAASEVWADRATPLLRFTPRDPHEVLLTDLGRAGRLYPELDEALRVAEPVGQILDTPAAYRFLGHAELLAEAGFGVLLPTWWQRRPRLGLTLDVHSRQTTANVLRDKTVDLDSIVDFRWGISLGEEQLTDGELAELAQAKVPLVRLRGRWVYLDRDRLAAGLRFLARGGAGQLSAGEALRLVHVRPDRERPLPLTEVTGSGWLADLLTGRIGERLEPVHPPATLTATLRPYQHRGLAWLSFMDGPGVGALLADDMGLGKTVQLLALEALRREGTARPPTLIVCPLSVLGNWQREIERFTPSLRVHVHHGAGRLLDPGTTDLVLTTYTIAARDADALAEVAWDRVVLDEAQHVKNAASATAQAIRRFPARHRVALTGTPVENRLSELWSIMDFLNPGAWGPASIFRARYGVPVERYGDDDAAARLRRLTQPYLLRRLKTDGAIISDLPEKLERILWCNLTVEQASLYRAVTDEMFARLSEGRAGPARKGIILAALTKLKQACNHPAHLLGDGSALAGRSGKLDRLEEILANAVADGDRALVFTQFARFGAMLLPYLRARLGVEVDFLYGGTPKASRDALVTRFQSGAGPTVLLLSLKAGGTGLNLTAANHVVHLDRWWNPATEAQATDRAYRIGQRRDVQVHTFVTLGTIEERVHQMLAEKRAVAEAAVGSGEGWLADLSTSDLMRLVTLAPEAADE